MFNRGSFNRTAFNRTFSVDVFFSTTMNGVGEMSFTPNMEYAMSVQMNGEGGLTIETIREIFFSSQMDGIGELSIDTIRERFLSAAMNGIGSMDVNFKKYQVDILEITNPFQAGDKIIIDAKKLTVRQNGQAIGYDGDFFDINPGDNVITYEDAELGRTIQIRVTHRDRYI
jgi:hypothetical protein